MKLKDIDTLPPGWLINYPDGTNDGTKWWVGLPRKENYWHCIVLATNDNIFCWNWTSIAILSSDEFTPIPPQDLVKYINYLTDRGVQYLKGLQL